MKNINVSNSAIRAFGVLQKLYKNDCTQEELLDGFSDDTLRLYLNTFKKFGLKISSPNKSSQCYSLKEGLNLLNINDYDIETLSKTKRILTQEFGYRDIIAFNNFLNKIINLTNETYRIQIKKIICAEPFGIELHELLKTLQEYINTQTPLLLEYNSPKSVKKYFKVMPKYIKLENSKVYLWCSDDSIKYTRYLPVKRIVNISPLEEICDFDTVQNVAVCEFSECDAESLNFENIEILKRNEQKLVVKIFYTNIFEFMQKILNYGVNCKILKPQQLQKNFIQKIKLIRGVYGE